MLIHLYYASHSDGSICYFSNISTEVKTSVTEYGSTHRDGCHDSNINKRFVLRISKKTCYTPLSFFNKNLPILITLVIEIAFSFCFIRSCL